MMAVSRLESVVLITCILCLVFGACLVRSGTSTTLESQPSALVDSRGTVGQHGDSGKNILCYYSVYLTETKGPHPQDINVTLCSHIIFLGLGISGSEMASPSTELLQIFSQIPELKSRKPELKLLLSSNGQNFQWPLASEENRTRFAESTIAILRKYQFDGLDLDWEFPAWNKYAHLPQQRHNFSLIVQKIREVYEQEAMSTGKARLTISAAVCCLQDIMAASYEPDQLAKYIDFINLMTYDIHRYFYWTPWTGYNSPLVAGKTLPDRTLFVNYSLSWAAEEWVRRGMARQQVVVGVPVYSHTFLLEDPRFHHLYSPATAVSPLGDEVSYNVVCQYLHNASTTYVWDDDCKVPYLYNDLLWLSFDNERSLTDKVQWIQQQGFGGVMTYCLNLDDFAGQCSAGNKFPLHTAIYRAMLGL